MGLFKLGKITLLILAGLLGLLLTAYLVVPHWLVGLMAARSPEVLYSVETEQPVVALTIDDGPDPLTTPKILNLLERHNARATFFVITSRVAGHNDLVHRMVANGHELANHLTVDQPSIELPPAEFERQLLHAGDTLANFAEVRWFRPGSGWYDQPMLAIVERHNYETALGSVYPFDPQIPSAWFASQYILGHVEPGSVIILHDYGQRGKQTAAVLAVVLPEMNRRGFKVVTLSELVDETARPTPAMTSRPR